MRVRVLVAVLAQPAEYAERGVGDDLVRARARVRARVRVRGVGDDVREELEQRGREQQDGWDGERPVPRAVRVVPHAAWSG